MADNGSRFTADEILAELRRREADAADKIAGDRRRSAAPPAAPRAPRASKIGQVATGDLVKALKTSQRAIYGVDNRKDHFELPRVARPLAAASVALVKAADLERDGTRWRLRTTSFREDYRLCSDEPFASQPLGCFCSGVLVAQNVIATAGHCVETNAELAAMRFVFGFRMVDRDTAQTTFDDDDVYEGVKLLGHRLSSDGTDWALVQLDRAVKGRTPVKLRTSGKIGNRDKVFVIGHPCGLPQKFADGATVEQNSRVNYFTATLDTYGGNSGSPVFSGRTRALEGLLVRGQTDFISVGNCRVSQVFPSTGAGGEDVTRVSMFAAKIPDNGAGGSRKRAAARKRRPAAKTAATRTRGRTRR
jgi:hypothetical protein